MHQLYSKYRFQAAKWHTKSSQHRRYLLNRWRCVYFLITFFPLMFFFRMSPHLVFCDVMCSIFVGSQLYYLCDFIVQCALDHHDILDPNTLSRMHDLFCTSRFSSSLSNIRWINQRYYLSNVFALIWSTRNAFELPWSRLSVCNGNNILSESFSMVTISIWALWYRFSSLGLDAKFLQRCWEQALLSLGCSDTSEWSILQPLVT